MTKDKTKTKQKLTLKEAVGILLRMYKLAFTIRPLMVIFFYIGALMEIVGSMFAIYASAKLVGYLASFTTTGNTEYIWLWLWLDIIAGIITSLGFFIMSYAKRLIYFRMVYWATETFLVNISKLDISDFYDDKIRNKIHRVHNSYTWKLSYLSDSSLELSYAVLRFFIITAVASQIAWWIIPLITLFLLPSLLAEKKLAGVIWFVWEQKGDERLIFWGLDSVITQVKGQMELRSLQAKEFILNKINKMNSSFYNEQESNLKNTDKLLASTKIIEAFGTTVGAVFLLKQFLSKSISLDRYFFLSGALFRVTSSLNNIFGTISGMQDTLLFAKDFFSLVEVEPKIKDKPDAVILDSNITPKIEFVNLSFNYPGHTESIFKDLNLTINPGEHIAIVGENGAGKSTLIKLLMRFYKPTSGKILIDGIDLQDLTIESWYDKIATLFQDFNQYPLSISENITVGRSNKKVDLNLRDQASEFASINKLIDKYKNKWDTVLDSAFKEGVEPSGGQWQRVALARAFYRQSKVLILDEPTSAIDAKAEYEIFNNIFTNYKKHTTIIISHRFSTVRRADRIIVIDQGKIIEEGSHQDLIKLNGLYANLFNNQAKGYRD